jgi:hypothetical protein
MRFVHAFGYGIAGLMAGGVGVSLMGDAPLETRLIVMVVCGALGAFVGWNRQPRK